MSSSLTQWSRVVAGARLVASAAAKQVSEDATIVVSRATQHGLDLSSKAQMTTQDRIIFPVLNQIAKTVTNNGNNNNQDDNNNASSSSSSYAPGTSPYESQLQSHIQTSSAAGSSPVDDKLSRNLNSNDSTSIESSDPYLFHSTTIKNDLLENDDNNNNITKKDDDKSFNNSSTIMMENNPDPYLLHAQPRSTSSTKVQEEDKVSPSTNKSNTFTPPDTTTTTTTTTPESSATSSASSNTLEHAITAENQIYTTTSSSSLQQDNDAPLLLQQGEAVPSTRVGRAMGFASLGVGLAWGTASELASRLLGGKDTVNGQSSSSAITSDANADRLAATLCRMRGAALKMGQMLSIQDESLLPPALSRALLQVRQGAHAMPDYQLEQQLESQLGTDWLDKFHSFDKQPFAAASIGQVHRATIQNEQGEIENVVVKVQYPGVAKSIESDLRNLSMLVSLSGLSPPGLFIENVIRVGRDELKVECNYINEMANQLTFRELIASDPYLVEHGFVVPNVIPELTTEQILVTEYAPGGTIDKVSHLDQEERNRIGRTILYLTMKELFEWRLMQTDPNWGNFLYDVGRRQTTLIDFGATRTYDKDFVDGYLRIVWASANRDEATLMEQSRRMNFLTGEESETMLRAHKLSGFTVGEPFWEYANDEPFDFRGSNISTRMGEHTSVFLRERMTPPPEEVYTLHRKLAGAYMLCIKLGAVVHSRDMLEKIVADHVFDDGMEHPMAK